MPGDRSTEPSALAGPAHHSSASRKAGGLPLLCLLPLLIIAALAYLTRADSSPFPKPSPSAPVPRPQALKSRLILIVVDSLRPETMDQVMPNVRALAKQPGGSRIDVTTGSANFSLPCLQTLMEGRESPFVANVHNFTGRKGSDNSLPAAAQRGGFGVAIVSDFILDSLYKRHALFSTDITRWGRTYLYRDLRAIDQVIAHLQDPRVDVLILHVPGTDKAAHRWRPRHPEYEKHFSEVDAKLAQLFSVLDFQRDHLLVTGDHGHDLSGAHERRSVALFRGGDYPGLIEKIGRPVHLNQTDLLFFMSFPFRLPLPVDYEGDYFNLASALAAADNSAAPTESRTPFQEFARVQKDFLISTGHDPALLGQSVETRRQHVIATHFLDLLTYAPMVVWYLLWILLAFHTNETGRGTTTLLGTAILAPLLWLISTPHTAGPLSLVMVAATVFCSRRLGEGRRLLTLAVLAVIAAGVSAFAQAWDSWFSGPFRLSGYLLPILITFTGAGLAWVRYRTLRALPEACAAACLFCLPSGVFDYQFGGNIMRGLFIGGGLTITALWLVRLRSADRAPLDFRPRHLLAVIVLGVSVALLSCGDGSGWTWHFRFRDWLRSSGWQVSAILYAIAGLYLISATRARAARMAIFLALLAMPYYCTWIGQLRFFTLASTLIVVLFTAAFHVMKEARWSLRELSLSEAERTGLVLFATLLMTFWIALGGFFLNQADFSFAFKYFGELQPESLAFVLMYLATLLKYGLPLSFLLLVYFSLSAPAAQRRVIVATLLFCHFKILTLFVQILTGRIRGEQKLFELAISDLLFVFSLPLIVVVTYYVATGLIALSRTFGDRLRFSPKPLPACPLAI